MGSKYPPTQRILLAEEIACGIVLTIFLVHGSERVSLETDPQILGGHAIDASFHCFIMQAVAQILGGRDAGDICR